MSDEDLAAVQIGESEEIFSENNNQVNVVGQSGGDDEATEEAAGDDDEEDEEEELITAQKVLESLETAWTNELGAPEILQHETEMLELMLGQVSHMEENMATLDKNDFRYIVHQMELERIRYIMASYLRCRLQKIETYTQHILNEEAERDVDQKRLSPEETIFAQEYNNLVENHFQNAALQYMPNIQRAEAEQRIVRPNLMTHVFIKANVAVPGVIVGVDEEQVDVEVGSQHIIPYQLVSDLIEKKQVQLL